MELQALWTVLRFKETHRSLSTGKPRGTKSMSETRHRSLPCQLWIAGVLILLLQCATTAWATDKGPTSLLSAGRRAFAEGNYKQAEEFIRQAAAEADIARASETDQVLILSDLASVLQSEGKFEESEPLFDRAVALLRSRSSDDKRRLPIILGNLGKLYMQMGRMERSEDTLHEALQLGKKYLRAEPHYLADFYNYLGMLHLRTGNRKQAERDFKSALSFIESDETDEKAVRKVPIMTSLSTLYYMDKKWSLAEQTLLQSVEIVERAKGMAHPNLCTLLDDLGFLYLKQNKLDSAEAVLRRDLAIRSMTFGTDSAFTASAAATLASVLAARGEYEEAHQLFTDALNTQERVLGRVPEVAATLDQFANLLRQTNNDALAGVLSSRAASIRLESEYTVSLKALQRQ